ncbi:MAG TPA: hypothetical protein ENK75_02135 [Saprospiraceae bacterium]|nr:hypothetical protein [Saprospiraceae bacterium]
MKHQKIKRFYTRFAVIVVVHFIVKSGDYSFHTFTNFTFRGFIFSIFFISYWLLIWEVAAYVDARLHTLFGKYSHSKKNISFILFIHLIVGFISAFLFNWLYRLGDIHLFEGASNWTSVSTLNPELTMSLLAIYLFIFAFDSNTKARLQRKENQLQLEKLLQETTLAKYLNLKSQIEPHFLFNSLSVLSSLVYTDVDLASKFILKLSKILRFVIEENEFDLVLLGAEFTFVEDYLFLIQTRFEDGIIYDNQIDKNLLNQCYVPPSSIQLLVENAIKHNKFSAKAPLQSKIERKGDYLVVSNNLNIRTDLSNSTGQGLKNLLARYEHASQIPALVEKKDEKFVVSLPIITSPALHFKTFEQ